ncbi:MAG: hypothetical protein ABFS18_02180 [Thermodesulfobacteriota bacterium]
MPRIKFTRGGTVWTANCDRAFPVGDPAKVGVVVGYSDGGQLYAYNKGPGEQFFELVFNKMDSDVEPGCRSFHETEAVGPLNTFTYTDQAGVDHTVRWMDIEYPIRQTDHNRHSGTIRLRKEI